MKKLIVFCFCWLLCSIQIASAAAIEHTTEKNTISQSMNLRTAQSGQAGEQTGRKPFMERIMDIFKGTEHEESFKKALAERQIKAKTIAVSEAESNVRVIYDDADTRKPEVQEKSKRGVFGYFERIFMTARDGIGRIFGKRPDGHKKAMAEETRKKVSKTYTEQMKDLSYVPQVEAPINGGKETVEEEVDVMEEISEEVSIDPNTTIFDKQDTIDTQPRKMVLQWYQMR